MSSPFSLSRGQIVATKSFVNTFGEGMNVTFMSPEGKRFMFVFLGIEDEENSIETISNLNKKSKLKNKRKNNKKK